MEFQKKLTKACAFAALLFSALPSASANVVTIGFDGIAASTELTTPYTEEGFVSSGDNVYADINQGNPAPEVQGIAALGGGILRIASVMAGQTFHFLGMDIAHRDFQGNTHDVIVEGFLDSALVASETFTTLANVGGALSPYSTITPTAGFLLNAVIDELRITLPGLSSADQFWYTRADNIQLSRIPEPVTLALFGLGMAGIFAARDKKLIA